MLEVLNRSERGVVFVLVLVVIMTLLAATGTAAAQSAPDCSTISYNGDGTETNPYEIGSVEQLQCIEEQGLDANYVQVSDIDASETASWNGGKGFEPIGNSRFEGTPFTGTFGGAGHDIADLTINRPTESNVGLFSTVKSDLTSVSVIDADITGDVFVGGVTGFVSSRGSVPIIKDSHVTGTIDGTAQVGGLVGNSGGTIEDSYMTGSVNGSRRVGGLVGSNSGTIEDSYMTGLTDGEVDVGGLVGQNDGSEFEDNEGVISDSYSEGSVEGSLSVGGLVGGTFGENNEISNSYSMASVEGNQLVGGFVGNTGFGTTVSNSYAIGSVTGSSEVGGFIGRASRTETSTSNSYWDIEATGKSTSDGRATGLTTSEMTGDSAPSNMAGFDFTTTWVTVTNDYPVLAWQQPTASFTTSTNSPNVEEAITFDASDSADSDGSIQSYEWDFDGDGTTDVTRTAPLATHTYTDPGTYAVTLTVIDDDGATNTNIKTVEVRDPSESPVEGVSDDLWTAVTQDDGSDGLSLADLGNGIQEYQKNPSDADVGGVSITLSDLGSLIQYYRTEVV
jgi:PKD repeat protein